MRAVTSDQCISLRGHRGVYRACLLELVHSGVVDAFTLHRIVRIDTARRGCVRIADQDIRLAIVWIELQRLVAVGAHFRIRTLLRSQYGQRIVDVLLHLFVSFYLFHFLYLKLSQLFSYFFS